MSRRIAICGGTSLGHAMAAVLGADPANDVRMLTGQPERWSREVRAIYLNIAEVIGRLSHVTDNAREAIDGAEIVFICTPLHTRKSLLRTIAPWLTARTWVGGVPGFGGFDREAFAIVGDRARIFGLQRVPYVRRTVSYGETVWISGIRPKLFVATVGNEDTREIAGLLEALLTIPTAPLSTYLAVALSSSNAIFHPARLMTAFPAPAFQASRARGDQFYEHWDDDASVAYLALDRDVQAIAQARGVPAEDAMPITRHFVVETPAALTARIRSIRALRDRRLPLRGTDRILDCESHYVNEDAWFALPTIKRIAEESMLDTPVLDRAIAWAAAAKSVLTQRN